MTQNLNIKSSLDEEKKSTEERGEKYKSYK